MEQSWKNFKTFLKCSQNKSECFGVNWKFRNILKAEQFTKQVRMFQNTFEKYLNIWEYFWNVPKTNFWNVFKKNLRYFITLWNVSKQTKSFEMLWKTEQFGHVGKQLRMFPEH